MRNYKITFVRSDGTKGSDTFTASSIKEAKQDFNACYRHDIYTILSITSDTDEL